MQGGNVRTRIVYIYGHVFEGIKGILSTDVHFLRMKGILKRRERYGKVKNSRVEVLGHFET